MEKDKITFPNYLIQKISRDAPSYQISENYGRRGGYYGDSEEYGKSYKSICIYVQNGIGNETELFKSIAKAAFKIQSSNKRKYPLILFGFGNTSNLQHENKFFDFGYISDKHKVNRVAETMSRISGNNTVTKAIIPELFPKVDIRSLYSGKIKIDDDDLLIIVGKKNEVFFDKKIEFKLKNKIRKRILFVEICKDNIHWQYKNYNPEYKTMVQNKQLNKNVNIHRYFSKSKLQRIKNDFKFLIKLINSSYGEFDFAIRNNYFNIYYKGNSLAKIEPKKDDLYKISINAKFFDGTKADNSIFYTSKRNNNIVLTNKQLHRFFQRKHLTELASRIKKVHNGEEIDFEQSLITDNLNKEKVIIIDRQITDYILKRKRLDLLALVQKERNKYQFLVMEVKLGNNSELKNKVASQLDEYLKHIQSNFDDYKKCYEIHFEQKKELGLIDIPKSKNIEIVKPVKGIILVGGYSGIAKKQIDELKRTFRNLEVKQFTNEL